MLSTGAYRNFPQETSAPNSGGVIFVFLPGFRPLKLNAFGTMCGSEKH